jgi:hypothetical protein
MDAPKPPPKPQDSPLWGASQIVIEHPDRLLPKPVPPSQPWVGKRKTKPRRR